MPHSSQSSRSSSSYSSGKIPLSCQSGGSRQHATYDSYLEPRYTNTSGYTTTSGYSTASGYSSTSSSSKSAGSSKVDKVPLSISYSSSSGDKGSSKTTDERYYASSYLDSPKPKKKSLSCQTKDKDARYYHDSSYYR